MQIEQLFVRYESIIPDFKLFLTSLNRPLTQSFRINTLKAKRERILALLKDIKIRPLPFYGDGFLLAEKMPLGRHIAHSLGLIYVQEAGSMLPVIVLDPRPGEIVLDLCAAPGSKTTQIAQMMQNTGLLIVNEVNRGRLSGLVHNIKRCGLLNEVVIGLRGEKIDRYLPQYFDRILIDAPCSVEGTIRKSKAVLHHWGLKNIERMARIQKGLIVSGFRALRPGGILVYSTCTIAPEENEEVVDYLLHRFPEAELLPVTIQDFKIRPGVAKWQGQSFDGRIKNCARILPQDNDVAPFFIARIMKCGIKKSPVGYLGKIPFEKGLVENLARRFGIDKEIFMNYAIFQENQSYRIATPQVYSFRELKAIRKGLEIGKIYGQDVKPDNDFIQIFGKGADRNFHEIEGWQVPKFLSGGMIKFNHRQEKEGGFIIIKYKGLPIGIGRLGDSEIKSEIIRERRINT